MENIIKRLKDEYARNTYFKVLNFKISIEENLNKIISIHIENKNGSCVFPDSRLITCIEADYIADILTLFLNKNQKGRLYGKWGNYVLDRIEENEKNID